MQARQVQEIAEPFIRSGNLSLWQIFFKHVHKSIPVCYNTFRKMLKEDVSNLDGKIALQHKRIEEQHDRLLMKKRQSRIRRE